MAILENPTFVALALLGFCILLLGVWIFILERRLRRLMLGKSGASLESTIAAHTASLEDMYRFRGDVADELSALDKRIKKKLHGAKTIRFNPFAGTGTGGNQSFATALLDEEGSGVVLSTLYSREKVSIFAKPIAKRKSEFELTDEEREVLS